MAEDIVFAQKLQAEFDEKNKKEEAQLLKDSKLAHDLSLKEHNVSDSDTDTGEDPKPTCSRLSNGTTSEAPSKKMKCKYGRQCYRKNPVHFKEYWHPPPINKNEIDEPKRKKQKIQTSSPDKNQKKSKDPREPFANRLKESEPFRFFLNKIFSVPGTHKEYFTLVLPDLLNPMLGELIESAQINFMVDFKFLMDFYKAYKLDEKPLLIIYGELVGNSQDYPKAVCSHVTMPFQFGVHHSKMMFFHYKQGLRIVIHTANLVPDDWDEKTQGFWISPLFPPLENGKSSLLDGESITNFKRDLVDYLLSYKKPDLVRWTHIIKNHDLSSCRAIFVGSVPGYYTGPSMLKYGHQKVRSLLRKHSKWPGGPSSSVIAQCSSIGSLGKDPKSWLTGELGVSLSQGSTAATSSNVHLIYPSEEDVRQSSQGYGGGSCLPYNSNTHLKQPWLKDHLHLWRCKSAKRSNSMPHIKSYTRLNKNETKAQYFIITSSNLSKAAWGQLQKQASQLFIRSYEAGILLLPKFLVEEDSFDLDNNWMGGKLSLPYDLPLTPYPEKANPWFMNTRKSKPDIYGQTYP